MKTRTEGNCKICGKDLTGMGYDDTHTKNGKDFCSYECLESYYGGEVPDNEDFLNAKS